METLSGWQPSSHPVAAGWYAPDEPQEEARRRRVVITGVGVVAPSGVGADAMWRLLVGGESAVRAVEGFDVAEYPVRIAGQIPGFVARDFMPAERAAGMDRLGHLAAAATRLAVDDARLPRALAASSRTGLFFGTAAGPVGLWEKQVAAFTREGLGAVRPTFPMFASPHCAAAQCANELGVRGPIATFCCDCPSGVDAVIAAYRQIAGGTIDAALAGGADAPITPLVFAAFARSGMLAADGEAPGAACRPFDRRRAGFVLAEGGAMLVLESAERAAARGARVYGEILGAGCLRDRPTYVGETDTAGEGYVAAISQALDDAELEIDDVDFVNAHAPGVPMTDLAEARALTALLAGSGHTMPVTSIKGALGHPLAAAGVLQVASTLLAFERGEIPPTLNCVDLDPECDLDVVRGRSRRTSVRRALVTSHGFGGNTTSLVLDAARPLLS